MSNEKMTSFIGLFSGLVTIKALSSKICLLKLNCRQSILFLLAASFALSLFLLLIQPLPFSYVMNIARENRGWSLFLNWLPLFLPMLLLYFAGLGTVTSTAVVGAFGILLSFANRFKILIRNDPLMPWDLTMGGELLGIAGSFGRNVIITGIVLVVGYIFAAVLAAMVIKSSRPPVVIRCVGVIACLLAALWFNGLFYNNPGLNYRLYISGNRYNQVNQFNSRGFIYSFIHAFNTNRIEAPFGHDPDNIREMIRTADVSGPERLQGAELPHIIMIMGEAFSDLSLRTYFDFSGFCLAPNPLANWLALKEESIHGHIVVPAHGGGTADTEFDVLTGLNTRQFRGGVPFSFRMINADFESMATILNSIGYRSEFMHPGFAWFYNRQNVYRWLGFERLVFIDEFEGLPTKGWYMNETDTINRVIEMFEEHLSLRPGVPYFHFGVTIQNHGPYVDKFLLDGNVSVPNFTSDLNFDEDDINALSNYFYGMSDADYHLRRLTDYLNASAEPVVLVYFGDHLPSLGRDLYDIILPDVHEPGSFEDLTRLFTVPFMIWFNDAAKELYGIEHPMDLLDEYEVFTFGANYLGAFVLEILGITNVSPFWDYVNEMRRLFPVMTETRSFDAERMTSIGMSDERRAPLIVYRSWSYFRLFEER